MMQSFTVRPTTPGRFVAFSLPLERGAWTHNPGACPVAVYDGDCRLPSQAERISRFPDGSASALMIYADAGPGNIPHALEVRWEPHRETEGGAEFVYHEEIREEREWFAAVVDGKQTMDGPVMRQFRHDTFTGSVAWYTFFNDSPAVRVDSFIHEAHPASKEDMPRGLHVLGGTTPSGWEVTWTTSEPLGQPDGRISDGTQHFFPQRGLRIMRAVLAPQGCLTWTDAHPQHGFAVATSEWQRMAAWAPHFVPAPNLAHLTGLAAKQSGDYAAIRNALANGTQYPPAGNYPQAVRHGFFHPSYSQEGGETSGYGITYGPPGDLIQTGNPDALMFAYCQQRMRRDRDRSACIEPDGSPSTYEGRRAEIDQGKIRFSADDPGRFDKSGSVVLDGSFGWSKQIPLPDSPERKALMGFETTDWAHRIRSSYWDSLLLQLANDPVSRYLIRMDGETARMAWKSGKRQTNDYFASNAGIGLPRDRILGWQLHAMALAFCVGNDDVRERFTPDLSMAGSTYLCATNVGKTISALTSGKQVTPPPYNGQYAVSVGPTAESLLTQGFVAAARATGDTLPWARILDAVRYYLGTGTQFPWSVAVWKFSDREPFPERQPGLDSTSPAWTGGKYDNEQMRPLAALVALIQHEAGEDTSEAVALLKSMLGATPRAKLRAMGAGVLDSDSVALAAADRLGLP